ncbi:hypothetical protein MPTK1_3g06990 [Marchantia polymorpha subsp. ruderalis]|uniref:Uncharacterized protein n=2 Tax=Marchantia polymorpha TaxID=3197 RepID=A0AAF6AY67_MARPO|nr:hypothetical protein MARPO_0006s0172 [Marchantia polymorpha]BBN04701.1 hypothetical protein Mp_3g06990 [Marchantia polymorpha subsp. ruderalis]|eukprot:PTQ48145.1 hypothetical protein MARPO_0006s0172 [Marchantia polymorpha]
MRIMVQQSYVVGGTPHPCCLDLDALFIISSTPLGSHRCFALSSSDSILSSASLDSVLLFSGSHALQKHALLHTTIILSRKDLTILVRIIKSEVLRPLLNARWALAFAPTLVIASVVVVADPGSAPDLIHGGYVHTDFFLLFQQHVFFQCCRYD